MLCAKQSRAMEHSFITQKKTAVQKYHGPKVRIIKSLMFAHQVFFSTVEVSSCTKLTTIKFKGALNRFLIFVILFYLSFFDI